MSIETKTFISIFHFVFSFSSAKFEENFPSAFVQVLLIFYLLFIFDRVKLQEFL